MLRTLALLGTCCLLIASHLACSSTREGAEASKVRPSESIPEFDLQGHRGARGLLPENTLAGIERALELGVTTVEVDVVISQDGQVVVSHEPWFNSAICSKPDGTPVTEDEERRLNLYRMPYDEIARYDCGRRGHPGFPEQRPRAAGKPLLSEVFEQAEAYAARSSRPPVRYNVEIKSRPSYDGVYCPSPQEFAERVYGVVRAHGLLARTTIQSFDPRSIEAVHQIDPTVATALLVDNDDGFRANLDRLTYKPPIYSPHHRLVSAALIDSAHGVGMRIVPWTVNDIDRMGVLIELGVDGLITDYPDRGQRVLNP